VDFERLASDFEAKMSGLSQRVLELESEVLRLVAENAELKARLNMNSRNSSKPPSSDGYTKPSPKSRRVRSGKKPGKQPGDKGHHLAQRSDPDAVIAHSPITCKNCGDDLSDAEVTGTVYRQVYDLPPVALFCTEHQAKTKRCSCGTETTAAFPSEATAPACYGPALRAYVCYLVTRQHIPIGRVAELLRDAYGAPISSGTIVNMVSEGAEMLSDFLSQVKDLLRDSQVVHVDETGLRVEALLKWVHATSTTDLTLYHLDQKRGGEAMDAMGVIEHLRGVLVHDGWKPYRNYGNVEHSLCNSHHLRELDAIAETTAQSWASEMIELLESTWGLVQDVKENGYNTLSVEALDTTFKKYKTIITTGYLENPPPESTGKQGRPKRSKALNLLMRLDLYTDDVLRFATDFSVPFSNNLSERDVRMVKLQQKISGGFRSKDGAEAFLAFRSYLSTASKQGINLLDALQRLFNNNPWMPASKGASP
jgi:transposase